ncbi:MAG: hypothetical protein P8Q97_09450 [Myxococcota bacterium]|nr:hypothetical protein [Myxococcota bacterium]
MLIATIQLNEIRRRIETALGERFAEAKWTEFSDSSRCRELARSPNLERDVADFVREFRTIPGGQRETDRPQERELRSDHQHKALNEILAIDASQYEPVVYFRETHLGGATLTPQGVGPWLAARDKEQGKPTVYLEQVPLGDDGKPLNYEPDHPLFPAMPVGRRTVRHIEYPYRDGEKHRYASIREGSVLAILKQLSVHLSERYSWPEADAVFFVLTGVEPDPPKAKAAFRLVYPACNRSKITLTVSPLTTPSELRDFYAEVRRDALRKHPPREGDTRKRARTMSPGAAELAVFITKANDGRTRKEAMDEWNRKHPSRSKKTVDAFRRSSQDAFMRVTGSDLEWKRRPGDQKARTKN